MLGPLKLRNILWPVPENEMEEVLLARPLIKVLSFGVIETLEAERNNFQDMNY